MPGRLGISLVAHMHLHLENFLGCKAAWYKSIQNVAVTEVFLQWIVKLITVVRAATTLQSIHDGKIVAQGFSQRCIILPQRIYTLHPLC